MKHLLLLDTKIPKNKLIVLGLSNVRGIGKSTSKLIAKRLGAGENLTIKRLTNTQINRIEGIVIEMRLNSNINHTHTFKKNFKF